MSLVLSRRSCRVCQFIVFNISAGVMMSVACMTARRLPFLASLCFRLCEDPKQCSSILIWVLLGFDMFVLLLFVIVLLDFF